MSLFAPIRTAILPTTLAIGLSACSGNEFSSGRPGSELDGGVAGEGGAGGLDGSTAIGGSGGISGSAGMAGQGGIAGSSGNGGLAGIGGMLDGGPDGATINQPDPNNHPTILSPVDGTTLSPARAFILWEPGPMQTAADIVGWRICYTKNDADPIANQSDCPNGTTVADPYFVLDHLTANSNYAIKVAAVQVDGALSAFEPINFDTDASTRAWYQGGEGIGNGDPFPDISLDASGNPNGNDGLLVSNNQSIWVSDPGAIDGGASQLDGANDYVDLLSAQNALSFDGSGNISVETRFRIDTLPANFESYHMFSLNGENGTGLRFDLVYINNGGTPNLWATVSGTVQDSSIQSLVAQYDLGLNSLGSYIHSIVTYTGQAPSSLNLYVDGQAVDSKAAPNVSSSFAFNSGDFAHLSLGAYIDTASTYDFLNGRIDDVIFDDRTLPPDEVKNRFCAGAALVGVGTMPASCVTP